MKRAAHEVDWEGVEREYRIGQLTVAQIAEKYGVSRRQVDRRAKSEEWTRDLSESVKAATKAKVISEAVKQAQEGADASVAKDFSEVDLAANVNASLIMRHQKRAAAISDALDSMVSELQDASANPQALEQLVLAVGQEDPLAAAGIAKAMSLPSRISIAKAASETLSKLVTIERQAFGLDAEVGGGSDAKRTAELIKDLDGEGD